MVERKLTAEQREQMRQELLVQLEARLENARLNYVAAKAAYAALQAAAEPVAEEEPDGG